VAKIFLARPDQLAARARPHARFSCQYCATCAWGGASRPGRRSKRHTAGAWVHRYDRYGLNEAPDAEVRLNQMFTTSTGFATSVSRGRGKRSRDRGQRPTRTTIRCTLAAGMVCRACSSRKDHRERADLDQGKAGLAADHVASERRGGRDLGWNYHPAPDRHGDCDRSLSHSRSGSSAGRWRQSRRFRKQWRKSKPVVTTRAWNRMAHRNSLPFATSWITLRPPGQRGWRQEASGRARRLAAGCRTQGNCARAARWVWALSLCLRAHASALTRIADGKDPNVEATRKHGSAILEQVNALQQSNRRVLEKLRPAGLTELGLREALGALLRLWGESHPDVAIETASRRRWATRRDGRFDDLPHHSGRPDQCLSPRGRHQRQRNRWTRRAAFGIDRARRRVVRVRDNGGGLRPDHKLGFGLTGMRERILALGGSLTIASGDNGVTVEAVIPMDARYWAGNFSRLVRDVLNGARSDDILRSSATTGGDQCGRYGMGMKQNGRSIPVYWDIIAMSRSLEWQCAGPNCVRKQWGLAGHRGHCPNDDISQTSGPTSTRQHRCA
jgi:Signal transduction histidine kinase